MPLVHVKNLRLDTERGECFDAANSKHDFLAHSHLQVAAIKLGSNQSVLCAVFRNIGVEQVDCYPSDAQFPKPGKNFPVQNRHWDTKLGIAPPYLADRQMIKILIEINGFLTAFLIDLLPEIAVPIQQTNRNEIQIEIASRFAMVASEDAQAAGVIRDRLVKTKFGREIRNGIFNRAAGAGLSVGIVSSEILFEFLKDLLEFANKTFVLRKLLEP